MLKRSGWLLAWCAGALLLGQPADSVFVEKPYLQLGDAPALNAQERMEVLWHTADEEAAWSVRYKLVDAAPWTPAAAPRFRRVAVEGIAPHRVYSASIGGLRPGAKFTYEVQRGGKTVFTAAGRARKPASQPQRFVVFGDCAQDSPGQRAVAYQTYKADPDFVFITGDIVYTNGRISEYRTKYFPIYNSDEASPEKGAPLLRSTLFLGAPGNHDLARRNLTQFPDLLAYFYYWSQPMNGLAKPDQPELQGTPEQIAAFTAAAGSTYPRMANFSFDYGNAHWTVIDSNAYINAESPALREWVANDLAKAKNAKWRFVGFHHPGFNSAKSHFTDQWMRFLSPVFEEGKVDIVFAGHVHNYQRSFPMTVKVLGREGKEVKVDWTLDKEFDGVGKTRPRGPIYIVTGAGGAHLYNPEQEGDPSTWQPFTAKYLATQNSMTQVEIDGGKLSARQIAADGKVIDSFAITK